LQLVAADPKLRTEAANTLLTLAGYEKSVHSITNAGGISRLVSLISFSPEHDEVVLALKLMLKICREEEHRPEVREAGGISALLDRMMDNDNKEAGRIAASCLAHLLLECSYQI
jgi:hypothetical protein